MIETAEKKLEKRKTTIKMDIVLKLHDWEECKYLKNKMEIKLF